MAHADSSTGDIHDNSNTAQESDVNTESWHDDKASERLSEENVYSVWEGDLGEFGEEGPFILPIGEQEYPSVWDEDQDDERSESRASSATSVAEAEETEDEKAAKMERERLIELVKVKLLDRVALRRRNIFLHKKLVEHFKKRGMDHVLKEDPKGFELEGKYLKRLYAYQEFRESQESEIEELSGKIRKFKEDTDELEEQLNVAVNNFIERQKEVSLDLVSTKTGKKLNERMVDRLLRRQLQICTEKGKLRLRYLKLKHLIGEKERQLQAVEYFGDGLHIMEYEQLKIDNQNYMDKIEEKEEELLKLRVKTRGTIQYLAQVREKVYAVEGDIELLQAKYREVESEYNITREIVGRAKKKRDSLREEYARLKMMSGLLTKERLLKDFERSIDEKERIKDILEELKSLLKVKKRKQSEIDDEYNNNGK